MILVHVWCDSVWGKEISKGMASKLFKDFVKKHTEAGMIRDGLSFVATLHWFAQIALLQQSGDTLKKTFSQQAKAQNASIIAERKERARAVKTSRRSSISDQAAAMSAGKIKCYIII